MTILKMMLAEIRYRKLNFLLSLLAVTVAVTLFVAGPVLVDGYGQQTQQKMDKLADETRKLMRDMGFNLLIVHKDTNMADFWAADFATADMPQDFVDRLAAERNLATIAHLVASLQQKIEFEGRKVLLVGYLPETTQAHRKKKKPMGYDIEPGTVLLGFELAAGRKVDGTVEILGKSFRIAKILPEKGSKEDITLAVHLGDAQALLDDKQGKINQILALGCNCPNSELSDIRDQLAAILPDTRITEFKSIALARAEQRKQVGQSRAEIQGLVETLAAVLTPIVVLAMAIWVGLLALVNVRQRRTEIGILRAIGKDSTTIACLLLGKAVLLGFLGGGLGFVMGSLLAQLLGVRLLDVPADQFPINVGVMLMALLGAPAVSAVASYLPTLSALWQDPAVVLRDQ
jgi:putative ABC transport system permease protein